MPPINYRTQQGYEPSLRARDQREQQTWGFSRLGRTGYQNTLNDNNITKLFSDEIFSRKAFVI